MKRLLRATAGLHPGRRRSATSRAPLVAAGTGAGAEDAVPLLPRLRSPSPPRQAGATEDEDASEDANENENAAPADRPRRLTRTRAHRDLPLDLSPRARKERQIQHRLLEVKDTVRVQLEAMVNRGEQLEDLGEMTVAVATQAETFQEATVELRRVQFWHKWRACLILGALVLLAALVGAACGIFYAVCDHTFDLARCPPRAPPTIAIPPNATLVPSDRSNGP